MTTLRDETNCFEVVWLNVFNHMFFEINQEVEGIRPDKKQETFLEMVQ